ncbi:DUF3343 domain-containing protein [Clostridium drakei]|uniref:Putative Se/S carrier protein-like domain-containing protein n=1 Tax=Clostridium drakei TaxID=332101 RepID=A0A2U8DXP4_9CLOT|nr:DUF3343 domain-containing protein [Clostridium drakei]AWI07476.1 hypothetical protein B9W14_24460 [Clostridium drakei]
MDIYYIITFQNTHGAISGESILKNNNIKVEIMPTPTLITKSCGISIKIETESINQVKSLVENGELAIKNIYEKNGTEYKTYNI